MFTKDHEVCFGVPRKPLNDAGGLTAGKANLARMVNKTCCMLTQLCIRTLHNWSVLPVFTVRLQSPPGVIVVKIGLAVKMVLPLLCVRPQ